MLKNIKTYIYFFLFFLPALSFSQVKVGDNPSLIDSSSILELESSTKALVITRLSSIEMNAITPLQGALVFNTVENCIFYYNGTAWINLCSASSGENQSLSFDNTTNILSLENGGQVDLSSLINDADSDTTNEIQTLTLNGSVLTLTNGDEADTVIDLSSIAGLNGLSAYEIWLNNGNTGTEAEFLASLVGTDGIDGTNGTNGIDGSNGIDGMNGADGLSAYQIWLNEGNTGTEADFLASLIGADGTNGTDGVDGTNGIDGVGGVSEAGTNVTITGAGTVADPYIISATSGTDDQTAAEVTYDNTTSGLLATDVQAAIDEINTAAGNVALVDNGDGTYTFTDAQNNTVTIADTSISTLVDNNNGTYTYTNEEGTTTTIAIQANNGLTQIADGTIQLGGALIAPTTVTADNTNTLALQGLENTTLDDTSSVVITDNTTGVLRRATPSSLVQQQQVVRIATSGQTQFSPPSPITDINKIDVYRNGVRIAFTQINATTLEIEPDAICFAGDEIRIVQLN